MSYPGHSSLTKTIAMKNIYLLAALLLSISIANAQLVTGSKLLGGGINLNFSSTDNDATNPGVDQRGTYGSIQLSLMRVRNPRLVSGFGLNFFYNHTKNLPGNNRSNFYGTGAYYAITRLVPLATKFSLALTGTAGADFLFGRTYTNIASNYDRNRTYNIGLNGNLGVWYQLHQRLLFTADLSNLLGLNYYHTGTDSFAGSIVTKSETNNIGLRSGLSGFSVGSITVGVRYILK
jgi:hypothetical protein